MTPKLSKESISAVQRIITGNAVGDDEVISPYRSGRKLVDFFGELGFEDVYSYEGGGGQARWSYAEERLEEINGTEQMAQAIEAAVDPRAFYRTEFDVGRAVEYLNKYLTFDGWALVESGPRFRLRPEGDDQIPDGTAEERAAWSQIEATELALRRIVGAKYRLRWSDRFEQTIRDALGDEAWQSMETTRAKHSAQYRASKGNPGRDVLEYTYLGQLGQLMMWKKAWDLFSELFKDKRQLEDLINAISPVRNDRAHFRSVPVLDLRRCQVACEDLRARLPKETGG